MNQSNHDTEHLLRCRLLIEEKLRWPPATEWRHYEFTELGEKILDATGVHLSATTLKRLFGKLKYDSSPSSATLNALATYLGYSSWADFKSIKTVATAPTLPPIKSTPIARRKAWIAGVAVMTVFAVVALLFMFGRSSSTIHDSASIVFASKPLAAGLPNSVVFRIDLKGNRPGSTIIQQSWDSTKTITLEHGQTEATGIYYFPGYFRAKLILDGQIVKEHDLFIRSNDWMATIDHLPVPTYLKPGELRFDQGMTTSESVLPAIKSENKPLFTTYHLVRPFDSLSSNNFSLETAIQNKYGEDAAICKTAKIFILCSKGAFIIPFTIPGCASDINLKLNDRYLEGKSNDLSSLCGDMSLLSEIKIEVRNKRVKIFLRDKLVREDAYTEGAGEIVGLRFSFLGTGMVKYVRLTDATGRVIYENGFAEKPAALSDTGRSR
jgi:hypothetical protein